MKRLRSSQFIRRRMCWAAILLLGGSVNAEPPRTDRLSDPLPPDALARLGRLLGHSGTILAGVFSPDGKLLVTAGKDNAIRVWDVEGRRERHRLKGHGSGATAAHFAFSADGARLVSGGDDGRICLWDPRTGRRLRFWAIYGEQGVTCLAVSPDGQTILTNNGPNTFCLWDAKTGTASPPIFGHRDTIVKAAFRDDGRTFVTASSDGKALVWDVAALRCRKSPQRVTPARTDCYGDPLPSGVQARLGSIRLQHKYMISLAAFSPDGKILAAASSGFDREERDLRLWDVRTGKELLRLSEDRTPWLHQLAASPDGKFPVGEAEEGIRFGTPWLHQLTFSPDGKILATLDGPGSAVHFWNVASGSYRGVAVRHKKSLSAFAFSPDSTKVVAAGEDEVGKGFKLYLWDVNTGEQLRVFDGHRSALDQIAFSADGKTLISASQGMDRALGGVRVWDVAGGKQRCRYEGGGTLAPNGQTIAYKEPDKLHVYAADTRLELWSASVPCDTLLYSANGKFLLTHSPNRRFHMWEAATGKEVHRSAKVVEQFDSPLCLSADGAILATEEASNILLWDAKTGRECRSFAGHHSSVTALSFSPDGKTLVSGSERGSVRLWETATAKELRVLREPAALVHVVAFSPDGRFIACGDRRNIVQLWDAATGAEVGRFSGPKPREDHHPEDMQSLAFSADGRTLAIGVAGKLFLWDTASKKPPRRVETHAEAIFGLTFSTDGRLTALLMMADGLNFNSHLARQEIVTWDVATGRGPRHLHAWTDAYPWSVAVSPDGKLLAVTPSKSDEMTTFAGATVHVFEIATGKEVVPLATGEGWGERNFSPNGTMLLAGGALWDLARGQRVGEVGRHLNEVYRSAFSPNGPLIAAADDDASIYLYPMPQTPRRDTSPPRRLSADELQALWNHLSSTDAVVAWRTVHTLVAAPRQSVPFLHAMLRPLAPLDRRRVQRLLADLDSDVFAEREQARAALLLLGERVESDLRGVLDSKPSLEVRHQVLMLLEQIERQATAPDALRILRATTVLERIGTPEALALLRRLAGGAAEARLTREAAAALERLTRRNAQP